jgi:hypothetical protein
VTSHAPALRVERIKTLGSGRQSRLFQPLLLAPLLEHRPEFLIQHFDWSVQGQMCSARYPIHLLACAEKKSPPQHVLAGAVGLGLLQPAD